MSHQVNTDLYEIAADHIDYWAGEGIGAVIEADVNRDDLDSLYNHIQESARLMFEDGESNE